MKKIKYFLRFFLLALLITGSLNLSSQFPGNALANPLQNMFLMANRVDVSWDLQESQQPILPRDDIKMLNLSLEYNIDLGNYFAQGFYDCWSEAEKKGLHSSIKIKLKIINISSWCSAAFENNTAYVNFSKNQTTKIPLYLALDENAPAYGYGFIEILVIANAVTGTPIRSFEKKFNLTFIPSYYPLITTNLTDINMIEITPKEKAKFPIEIENLGNARTKVILELKNIPDDWNAVVDNEITLDNNTGSKDIANLIVHPPKNFGFHDEKVIIQVALTPTRADNISDTGDTMYATFLIKSKGFSTPGFKAEAVLSAFAFLGLNFYLRKIKKKKY